jgi:methyltransferase-like protein/2-polyprenyl-3-methyl-5-hydroxy-6-metoxy-1,4-benzoquinol methylase
MSQTSAATIAQPSETRPPVPASQSEFLETIGRLRGMQPAAAGLARVLELGCAAGENLLPLADRYPEARFLGVDPSAPRIESAAQMAREAGLANVEFRKQDLQQLDEQLGTFDYIIAYNVYSRDDRAGRDKLLAVCRRHLAPQGIAYVSYRTYPGWFVNDMLRAMMQYDARGAADRNATMARARKLLAFLQASLVQAHPYDLMVRAEAAELSGRDDDALWQDHLAPFSHPVYFPQFVEHAQSQALQLAGDAAVGIRLTDCLWPSAERQLEALNGDDASREMFRDVVQNRALREALLCHQEVAISRALVPEMLAGMYLEGALRPETGEVDLLAPADAYFASPGGARTSTAAPLVKAALVHLGEAWPDYVRFEDLVTAACARCGEASPGSTSDDDIERLKENLMHLCVAGSVRLHSHPPSFVPRAGDAPRASSLARAQARKGGVIANRRHQPVTLDPFDCYLLDLLDGTRNASQLVEHLARGVGEGRLIAERHNQPLKSFDDAREAFAEALPDALARLARSALLIG